MYEILLCLIYIVSSLAEFQPANPTVLVPHVHPQLSSVVQLEIQPQPSILLCASEPLTLQVMGGNFLIIIIRCHE